MRVDFAHAPSETLIIRPPEFFNHLKFLETVQFFSTIPVVPFDMACERQFQALRAMRLRVGSRDLRIAATALVHSVVLITRNRRDFEQVPGLRLDDWSL